MPKQQYRGAHEFLRKRWAPMVAAGIVRCARCGKLIERGIQWDLGHVDGSAYELYSGPEHRRCIRATARHALEQRTGPFSRRW